MTSTASKHKSTYNTLLIQKLLNLRDGASPFTLIIDSLEQDGLPIINEFRKRAQISDTKSIFVSFTTPLKKVYSEAYTFINARRKSLGSLRAEILSRITMPGPGVSKSLLIIDSLTSLASSHPQELPEFLTSLVVSPATSLVAVYHIDIPLLISKSSYSPEPLLVLKYLATTILTVSSLAQTLFRKRARDRSQLEPRFGLEERKEGVLIGLNKSKKTSDFVVHMESRRRSGRSIVENFVFMPSQSSQITSKFILLDDHPEYASTPSFADNEIQEHEEGFNATFKLDLTEKQKKDREEVVLPYFDAQINNGSNGPGEGGRILYQMGTEDREDFDDEEDEI
ncbi:Elongator complex protein 5 [Golovinomyces cichoracearum]|uniref:Elongator complex protein 5 n=1 Tax=Golovinomyces cichoracearum TaxID=62708 RepID=A0A420J0B3_9PEZI|nr:Elongator complex protein 5 [Golovinomyces cichoracearum]